MSRNSGCPDRIARRSRFADDVISGSKSDASQCTIARPHHPHGSSSRERAVTGRRFPDRSLEARHCQSGRPLRHSNIFRSVGHHSELAGVSDHRRQVHGVRANPLGPPRAENSPRPRHAPMSAENHQGFQMTSSIPMNRSNHHPSVAVRAPVGPRQRGRSSMILDEFQLYSSSCGRGAVSRSGRWKRAVLHWFCTLKLMPGRRSTSPAFSRIVNGTDRICYAEFFALHRAGRMACNVGAAHARRRIIDNPGHRESGSESQIRCQAQHLSEAR